MDLSDRDTATGIFIYICVHQLHITGVFSTHVGVKHRSSEDAYILELAC